MAKERVPAKGLRLWVRANVNILERSTDSTVAAVKGDHDFYLVRLNHGEASCQCKWFQFKGAEKPCSHIEAVRVEVNDPLVVA